MPVKVTDTLGNEFDHEQGQHVDVQDGHLVVLTTAYSSADTLAVYAPGQWSRATADKKAPADL